ncbi:TonB-dependent receptor [Psychrosphaera sp. 1_MG-2023]|uniref:TonB-dependent receptor plug domain-containing protein n=1 Tax=Psychrosphaera sp. 1_MG-2023 TaxID=3062643 RepID=UPI0026E487B9|nr:TonB-dependent receptor [Psychrosphaera sp. 1_MG-2023]MDO6719935.1 TonB-dependent receptor [Psychrosphaera sp. 1_MG-2023]
MLIIKKNLVKNLIVINTSLSLILSLGGLSAAERPSGSVGINTDEAANNTALENKNVTSEDDLLAAVSVENNATPYVETLVITGTRTAKLLSDSPVSVDVIERDTLKLVTQGTLAQALEFIPSVVLERSVKDGYTVKMRGYGSKHIAVLLNGQPLISPANGAVDLDQISAHNIERIEVIKGAASVLYGSSAMGGVINIITTEDVEPVTQIRTEIGIYDANDEVSVDNLLHTTTLSNIGRMDDWQHQISLQHVSDPGFDLTPADVQQDSGELTKNFAKAAISKSFSVVDFSLSYDFLNESKNKITAKVPGQSNLIYYVSDVEQHQLGAGLSAFDNHWHLKSRFISHDETSGRSNSIRDAQITLGQLEGLYSLQHGKVRPQFDSEYGGEVVFGFATNFDKLDQVKPADNSIEVANESRSSVELYSQYNFIKSDHQYLLGIRSQYDSDFGMHTALRLSAMFDVEVAGLPLKVRGGYGQGYRVPDLKERYYVFDHSNLGYKVLGNEDLKPEQSDSYNLSVDYTGAVFNRSADLQLSFDLHYSETKDLIATREDAQMSQAQNLSISQYKNIEKSTIEGFDISAELRFLNWNSQLNYSYVDAVDQSGKRLEARPRHQVKANIGYDLHSLDVQTLLYAVYQADEVTPDDYVDAAVDGFTTLNFSLNHTITSNLQWHLSLLNLTDEHRDNQLIDLGYFDPRPVSSRTIKVGVNYQF